MYVFCGWNFCKLIIDFKISTKHFLENVYILLFVRNISFTNINYPNAIGFYMKQQFL